VTVVPLPPRGEWLADARDGDRALRVSWHHEQGCVVLSTWRGGECVGTVRLPSADVARLITVLAEGLAQGHGAPTTGAAPRSGARGRA
jgi:hypothetical protein